MISVVIPTYNRESSIYKSVKSVLNQTYQNIEVIVVDDGSTDKTEELIKGINDPRLRYVFQDNAGACRARNNGVEHAHGKYIAFHDSDDVWHKEKLEKQINVMIEKNADVVFCKLIKVYDSKKSTMSPANLCEGFININTNLFGIGTQSLLCKKEVLDKYSFDENMPRLQDLEFMMRVIRNFSVYCLDEGLVDYYIGNESIGGNPYRFISAYELLKKKYPRLKEEYPALMNSMAFVMESSAKQLCLIGDRQYKVYLREAYSINRGLRSWLKYFSSLVGVYSVTINMRR